MGTHGKLRPVSRFLAALEEENIRFMLIGMSAAIVQGVMESTLDVDLWIDLPSRQYMRLQNIARRQNGAMGAPTVAYVADGTPVNFVFSVDGLGPFAKEFRHTRRLPFQGLKIPVLKLERILKSKEAIRRDKDLPHIIHITNLLKCRRTKSKPAKAAPRAASRMKRKPVSANRRRA
ncbi:MAG: hypothetical protein HZA89_00400 [Verrucomicrobia bacterium]|nr:hypothetical protein [Verrucomicrobiota bacterium]